MVVNRKQPVVPAPPISRTASSQPIPTKRQTRSLNASSSAQASTASRSDQKPNGHRLTPLPRRTKSSKLQKKRKSKTFTDYLILFFLSAFTCYSFYACRPNPLFSSPLYDPQPPLCRALTTYRTHVLEPYVLPPIKQTLHYAHKISEPYVEEARIHLSPYFEPTKIVINTLTPPLKSLIRTTKSFWKHTVTPLYTQTLWPYYETAVVPRYVRYVKPLLVPLQNKVQKLFAYYISSPVRSKTNFVLHKLHQFYTLYVDRHMRIARLYIHRFFNTTRAVAMDLSTLYTAYLHPSVLKVWNVVHPIFCTSGKRFLRLTDVVYVYAKWIAREVGAYRRQYVDRHVDRILEQVAEPKVNGNAKETASSPSFVIKTRITSESQDLPSQETPTAETPESGTSSSPIAAAPTSTTFTTIGQSESSASMPSVEAKTGSPEIGTPTPGPLESAVESTEENAIHVSRGIHEFKEYDTLIDSDSPTSNTPSPSSNAPTGIVAKPAPESDPDLEEFLREIGVGEQADPVLISEDTPETYNNIARPKTEEELLAETAAKRADIVGRHENWFEKLHAGVEEVGDGLVRTLQSLRDDAAEEVRRLGTHPPKVDPNEVGKVKDPRSLVWVEQDGEKLIKGLDVYLQKAEGRCNHWKIPKDAPDDEAKQIKHDTASKEKEKFSEILSKVEAKFVARVDDVRLQVHNWYVSLKEREAGEVIRASNVIKGLATRAQEDLGMDYAWLDDVTYLDWQRYHDLMRVHENFDITVRQIANGTSTDPTPPSDPVLVALDELDRDLQDLILGFNYALSGIRSRGLKVFNLRPLNGEINDDDDDDGFFVVRDNERRVVDLRGVDLGKVELKKEAVGALPIRQDESVGILPVPDAQVPENGKSGFDASKIIIGKDKVQIEEAFRDIPVEPPAQRHTEL